MSFSPQSQPFGLYIHVPFCERKCPYCDFNTYAGLGGLFERTVEALRTELSVWGERLAGRRVTSVFVGGGTPTVLSHAQLSRLVKAVRTDFALSADCEISVEANPGTVDREKFRLLHDLGVNRLSMGVQSFQAEELAFLGRIHGVEDATAAFEAARAAGFENVNLDFIFGLPHQRTANWEDTLARALSLQPEHLSLYSLIVEPGTPLQRWVETGKVDEPDDDDAGELYELALERLAARGYAQYEVSNWAKLTEGDAPAVSSLPQLACRHNLLYWRNGEYAGIGPGAHSHLRVRRADGGVVSRRWSSIKPVPEYVRRIEAGESVEDQCEEIDTRAAMGETMMLGLRLVREGVRSQRFEELHGVDPMDVFGSELERLEAQGLVAIDTEGVRLTRRGLMIGNQVFAAFLPEAAGAVAA